MQAGFDTPFAARAQRIEQRTQFDIEMIEATGSCAGIENYSRYLSGRGPGGWVPSGWNRDCRGDVRKLQRFVNRMSAALHEEEQRQRARAAAGGEAAPTAVQAATPRANPNILASMMSAGLCTRRLERVD